MEKQALIKDLRKQINRIGKKGKANLKNVAALKIKFDALGIRFCEMCGKQGELTFAHRTTRQHIRTQEEMEAVARLCSKCHMAIEGKPNMSQIIDEIIASRIDLSWQSA